MFNDRLMEPSLVQSDNDHTDHIQGIVPDRVSAPETDKKIGSSLWFERILPCLGDPTTLCCTLEISDKNAERENVISICNNKYIST